MARESNNSSRRRRGRPDYHDPTSGIGGAAPAYSALTLRIVLSSLGLLTGIVLIILALTVFDEPPLLIGAILLAVLAAINLAIVIRRKARGEPG